MCKQNKTDGCIQTCKNNYICVNAAQFCVSPINRNADCRTVNLPPPLPATQPPTSTPQTTTAPISIDPVAFCENRTVGYYGIDGDCYK